MFEKSDYLNYFNQLLKIELEMQNSAQDLFDEIGDGDIRSILQKIIDDENRHVKLVGEIIELVS